MLAKQQKEDGVQDIDVSDTSEKASSPLERDASSLEQTIQTIQFGSLPEILINVAYILPEKYRSNLELMN